MGRLLDLLLSRQPNRRQSGSKRSRARALEATCPWRTRRGQTDSGRASARVRLSVLNPGQLPEAALWEVPCCLSYERRGENPPLLIAIDNPIDIGSKGDNADDRLLALRRLLAP